MGALSLSGFLRGSDLIPMVSQPCQHRDPHIVSSIPSLQHRQRGYWGASRWPKPLLFSQRYWDTNGGAYCDANGKCTVIQLEALLTVLPLAHRNRCDFCDCDCDAHHGPQKSLAISETLRCDLRVRWKVASDLRFRVAISEPETPSFCRISGDLAPSTRKSLVLPVH